MDDVLKLALFDALMDRELGCASAEAVVLAMARLVAEHCARMADVEVARPCGNRADQVAQNIRRAFASV